MGTGETTQWTVIREAAAGDAEARAEFVRIHAPTVRGYLRARWSRHPLLRDTDDAVQEVFLDCLRDGGALTRVEEDRPGGFRAFLYGVVRNVARRAEERFGKNHLLPGSALEAVVADDETLAKQFDRAWATGIVREAVRLHRVRAAAVGEEALARVELLRLRFAEGLPIREIAAQWGVPAKQLHRDYAKARKEYHAALREVVERHLGSAPGRIDEECARLAEFL